MSSLEERVAALEEWRDAQVRADLGAVRKQHGSGVADIIAAMGLTAQQGMGHFTFGCHNAEERLTATCLTCGGVAGMRELARAPFPHADTCTLAAPPQRRNRGRLIGRR